MAGTLRFYGWRRSGVYQIPTNPALTDGRLSGSVTLTLTNQLPPAESVSAPVPISYAVFCLKKKKIKKKVPS